MLDKRSVDYDCRVAIVIEGTPRRAAQAITEVHSSDYWNYCRYRPVCISSSTVPSGLVLVSASHRVSDLALVILSHGLRAR